MVTLEGSVKRRWDIMPDQNLMFPATGTDASIISRVVIPLYQGCGFRSMSPRIPR